MIWKTARRTFDLTHEGVIMGVLNVTPDSFSDGGRFLETERAIAHGRGLIAEGAEIIDVGGESTRPGATPVSLEEELKRVVPVIAELSRETTISVDTMKPEVARAAMKAGAAIINDVSGLRDERMRAVVRETSAGAVAMHMQGTPETMQDEPLYADVVAEVRESLRQTFDVCLRSGIDMLSLAFDPGIGFGKTAAHNLALLRELRTLEIEGRPTVLGVSRKSFLGKIVGSTALEDRAWPTVALTAHGRAEGARVFRVHEPRANFQALRMAEALLHA